MATLFFSLVFLARVLAEEVATPSSLLGGRNFNLHAFTAQYRPLNSPETTKQGPVLFPNDAPPPPRPPLIVTSRPLSESIARSELNPLPQNNSIPLPSQLNHVVKPYLARIKDYRPFAYVATPAPSLKYLYPKRERYEDYEERPLPPIYKVLADHAKQKVSKIKQHRNKNYYDYQKGPEYYHHRRNKDNRNGDEDDEGKNYAFSYRVKDQKTGDDFSHSQQSSGSATNGEYRVRLPDGRMQIVSYTADENGYQADVRYADDEKTSNDIDDHKHDNYNYRHSFDDHNSIDQTDEYNRGDHVNIKPNRFEDHQPQYDDKFQYKNDNIQTKAYQIDEGDDDKYKTNNNDYYNDNSKEYYNDDFSKEYESKSYDYAPHVSKFSNLVANKNVGLGRIVVPTVNYASQSTVRPSYEELKDLLVTKAAYNTVQPDYDSKIPVTISVPSTTPSTFEGTTERVVLIGGKKSSFYTDIRHIPLASPNPILGTPSPDNYVSGIDFSPSPTPENYLVSTINSLKNQVDLSGPKPILSNSFINKINKYLSFN